MPLTKAEQAELDKLKALDAPAQKGGLTPAEQVEFKKLKLIGGGTVAENPDLARFKGGTVTGPQGATVEGNDIPLGKPMGKPSWWEDTKKSFDLTPLGLMIQGSERSNSTKNAVVNQAWNTPDPHSLEEFWKDLQGFGKTAVGTFKSGQPVSLEILKASPNSGLAAHVGAKAVNFGVDLATDPTNALLAGPAGKLMDESAKAMKSVVKGLPAVQKGMAKVKAIIDPLKETAAGASVIRGLGWFGIGPQHRMFKEVQSPHKQALDVQAQRIANVLQDVQKHSIDIQRDPIVRAYIQDHAAVTKENPVIELIRERMQSLNKPGRDQAALKIAEKAKGFGIDPAFVESKASELRNIYDDAQKEIIKANNGRKLDSFKAKENRTEQQTVSEAQPYIGDLSSARERAPVSPSALPEEVGYHTETAVTQQGHTVQGKADEQYQQFIENVLGEKQPRNQTARQRLLAARPKGAGTDARIVREAGIRNLIQDMPTKFPEWVQPVTESVKPGWVAIQEGGLLDSLAGYQVPEPLYNMLENEVAGAGLGVAKQIRSEYIIAKDVGEALNKNLIGQIKKGFISTSPTQTANIVANLGQQSLVLKDAGIKVTNQERVQAMLRGFKQAWDMGRQGIRSKTIEEISAHSPSLLDTSIDTAIGKPSPQYGQLPEVIGAGRFSTALPRPQGLTARLFGEGRGGTAVATAGKALGTVNPIEQLANFQGLAERATKIATYELLHNQGKLDAKAATALVEKVHFDYSDRSHAAEMADRFGIWIFNAYPQKAFGLFMDTVLNHPSELLRYQNLRHLAIGNDDPSKNRNLPDWMRKSKFTVPLGDNLYTNVGRFHHFGGVIDQLANLGHGVDVSEEVRNIGSKTIYNPLFNIAQGQQTFARDERGNPPLLAPGQPVNELPGLQRKEFLKAYFPSMVGGRAGQAFLEVAKGIGPTDSQEPRTYEDVALQYLLGIRVTDAKTQFDKLIDSLPGKSSRQGVAETVFWKAYEQASKSPTDPTLAAKYQSLDPVNNPQGFLAEQKLMLGYIKKLLGSTQVTNTKGQAVARGRLENAARLYLLFDRRAGGQQ
jgi:hypothetical protein